ncbi:MAG: holin, partial [Bacteroidales bacterium]|nr:holin [Bacteroidales bacterium]
MTTGTFWAAALERAVKTAAQVAAALIGTGAVGITELDWAQIGSVSATSAVLSVLTSLASDRI